MGVNQVLLGAVKIMDISDSTVTSDKMLKGVTAYDKAGDKITGTVKDNGSVSATFDGIDTKSVSVPAGYTSGGTVALDGTIDAEVGTQADLISQIKTALEGKAAGGGGGGSSGGEGVINTCNLQMYDPLNVYATIVEGGVVVPFVGTDMTSLNNILCNSVIVLHSTMGLPIGVGGFTSVGVIFASNKEIYAIFKTAATPGDYKTI